MDSLASRKVSSSMRNAITTNNYQDHVLGKTVKQLEVERDLKMLSLQIETDEMKFSSSSPKMKARKVLSLPGDGNAIEECTDGLVEDFDGLKKEKKGTFPGLAKRQFLPLIRSHSAKSRRSPSVIQQYSANIGSFSTPSSPKALHGSRTNSLSSSASSTSIWETDRDRTNSSVKDCQQQFPPTRYSLSKLNRSNTASPILTAKFPKSSPSMERGATGASPPSGTSRSNASVAHRGLGIRPLSSISLTKQFTSKHTQEKSTKVFSRLYQVQHKSKKTVEQLLESSAKPTTPNLERRRRSLSMPDLTDMMDDLRNCRYLRKNSIEDPQ